MDRYEQVMDDVRQKTDDEELHWKAVNVDRYSAVLIQTHRIVRAFEARYPIGNQTYQLLFIEKKLEVHDEMGNLEEGIGFQLLILDETGQIVLSLYEGVVDRDDLLRLSGLIEERNDLAKKFFGAFAQKWVRLTPSP